MKIDTGFETLFKNGRAESIIAVRDCLSQIGENKTGRMYYYCGLLSASPLVIFSPRRYYFALSLLFGVQQKTTLSVVTNDNQLTIVTIADSMYISNLALIRDTANRYQNNNFEIRDVHLRMINCNDATQFAATTIKFIGYMFAT